MNIVKCEDCHDCYTLHLQCRPRAEHVQKGADLKTCERASYNFQDLPVKDKYKRPHREFFDIIETENTRFVFMT